jgi:adenylate cyclase
MYKRTSALSLATRSHQRFGARSRIVAMFADMRGFSNWSETQPLDHVADLVKLQFGYVMQLCDDYQQPFQKFLGDGFVLLWELESDDDLARCLASALDATFALHKGYAELAQSLPYSAPAGYGVGISIGEAIRIQLEPHLSDASEVDFVGYPLNCAARMQTLASGFGTALCASTVVALQSRPGALPAHAAARLRPQAPHAPAGHAGSRRGHQGTEAGRPGGIPAPVLRGRRRVALANAQRAAIGFAPHDVPRA